MASIVSDEDREQGSNMVRLISLIPAVVILCGSGTAFAQDWATYLNVEDGFSATFPGQPKVEPITYATEYRMTLPGRVYRASDALGRYSTTVVDYRGVQKLHDDASAACRAAKGANGTDGDACQNDGRVEVSGAMDFAAWNIMKREGIKLTHYMWYFNQMVAGRLLQVTNPDESRTFAVIHQHAGRLYIHEATVNPRMPEPVLFMQNLAFLNEARKWVRYRTFYTEGYGEWQFPSPPPPRTERDPDTSPY